MSKKLRLPDVTLVMIETQEHELAAQALADCIWDIQFGEVLVFTDQPMAFLGIPARFIPIPHWPDKISWSLCSWYDVPVQLKTSHALYIQWDSWVLNPECWRNDWMQYDVIGAPWPQHSVNNVGNLGFSLRSRRLGETLIKHKKALPCCSPCDDDQLCRVYRPVLEQRGLRWAPVPEAAVFSFEMRSVPWATFGFHGMFNWPLVMQREALLKRVRLAAQSPYITGGYQWKALTKYHPDVVRAADGPGVLRIEGPSR